MREIKFRVWDGFRYIYFDNHRYDLIYNDISGWNVCPNVPNYKGKWTTGESSDTAESFKMEQLTGLKDKNGVDIYEGDLIKLWDHYNEVFTSDCAEVIFSHHYVGGWVVSSGGNNLNLGMRTKDIEVVGNIHESPELLNQLKEEK